MDIVVDDDLNASASGPPIWFVPQGELELPHCDWSCSLLTCPSGPGLPLAPQEFNFRETSDEGFPGTEIESEVPRLSDS